jgi:hypothetical protein
MRITATQKPRMRCNCRIRSSRSRAALREGALSPSWLPEQGTNGRAVRRIVLHT